MCGCLHFVWILTAEIKSHSLPDDKATKQRATNDSVCKHKVPGFGFQYLQAKGILAVNICGDPHVFYKVQFFGPSFALGGIQVRQHTGD